MAQSTILVQLPLFPKTCADCGLPIAGRNRQRCASCAGRRKQITNAAYWQRVAAAKPDLVCVQCGGVYKVRAGRPDLREYCQPCALQRRREAVRLYDRVRPRVPRDPVQRRAYSAQYRRAHPQWHRADHKRYRQRHPEKVREQTRRRRMRRRNVPGDITQAQFWALCEQHGWHCHYCAAPLTRATVTMDHVIPLGRPGCTHDAGNIVPACRRCNASKGDRSLDEWAGPPSLRVHAAMALPETA